MIINCFNEEVKASNKNCKVNGSAVCFLYSIFFLCYFYSGSLHCFNRSLYCFLREKVDGSDKSQLLGGFENTRCWMVWKNAPTDNVTDRKQ